MKRLSSLAAALWLAAAPVSASQWCETGNSSRFNATERTICATPRLRVLDTEMASRFYARLDAVGSSERERLRNEQFRTWLPFRNACKANRSCLMMRYQTRIAEFGGTFEMTAPPEPSAAVEDFAVTPEGWIERPGANGGSSLYDPSRNARGFRRPDGQIIWSTFVQSNPLELPDLGSQSLAWANSVDARLQTLRASLLSPAQVSLLENHQPNEFFERLDYWLHAMNNILQGSL